MLMIQTKRIFIFIKHYLSLMYPTDLFFIFKKKKTCAGGGEPVCDSLSNPASWRRSLHSSDRCWDSVCVWPAASGTRSVGHDLGAAPAASHRGEVALFRRQMETQFQGHTKKNYLWKFISYCGKIVSNWLGCFINYRFLWDEIKCQYCKLAN